MNNLRYCAAFVFCAATLLLCPAFLAAQSTDVPHTISYQGLVTQSSGAPITDGGHVMTFTLYSDSNGGRNIWSSRQMVRTSQGIFNVLLGDSGSLIPTPMNVQLWLGTRVGEDPEMRPPTKLASAPYALGIVDNAVSTAKIQNGAVATTKLKDSAVTAPKMGMDYVGHVTVNAKQFSTSRGKDIDISVGPNLTMTTTKDSVENIHLTIDGPPAGTLPSGAIVMFPTAGPYAGFTATGQKVVTGDRWRARNCTLPYRQGGTVAALNGKVYAMGGNLNSNAIATVDIFDSATNSWSTGPTMNNSGVNFSAAVVNGKIYAIGAGSPSTDVEVLDPAIGLWQQLAPMPTPRTGVKVCVVAGKIYAIGGYSVPLQEYVATVEEFNPAGGVNGTWATKPSLQVARANFGIAALNGVIYVMGGSAYDASHNGIFLASVEALNPQNGGWTYKNPMQYPTYGQACVALGSKIYAFGGSVIVSNTPSATSRLCAEFDPSAESVGTWSYNAPLYNESGGATAVSLGTTIYLVGGNLSPGSGTIFGLAEYTPPTWLYCFSKN